MYAEVLLEVSLPLLNEIIHTVLISPAQLTSEAHLFVKEFGLFSVIDGRFRIRNLFKQYRIVLVNLLQGLVPRNVVFRVR